MFLEILNDAPKRLRVTVLLGLLEEFHHISKNWVSKKDITWIYTANLPTHMPALAVGEHGKELVETIHHLITDEPTLASEVPEHLCKVTTLSMNTGVACLFAPTRVFLWERCDGRKWGIVL